MTLKDNIGEVNSSFVAIKNKIVECGVDVADNTNIQDYADKVGEVFNKGREQGRNNPVKPTKPTVTDGRNSLAYWYQSKVGLVKNYVEADNEEGYSKIRPTPIESLAFPTGTQNIIYFSNFLDVFVEGYSDLEKEKIWVKKFTGVLDVASATSMASRFCIPELEEVGEIINSGKVTDFSYMFANCMALKIAPLLDTSNGTKMKGMFSGCSSLISVPDFDVPKATDTSQMFQNCSSLTKAPRLNSGKSVSHFGLFSGCSVLTEVADIDTSAATDVGYMFRNCTLLKQISPMNLSNATNFTEMFLNCKSLINVPPLNTSKGKNFQSMFAGCESLVNAPVLDTSSGQYFNNMFKNCYNMTEAPVLDTSNGINLTSMFEGCTALVDAPQMNTTNVQRLNYVFHKCSSLVNTQLYDTSGAVNLAGLYAGCSALTFVPFIDASNSGTLDYIFTGCHKLQNIEGIKVGKDTTTLNDAFNTCNKLERCIFSGTIYKAINMKWSKLLNKESITSVINALSTETDGISATISKTAVNNAFETSIGAKDGSSSPEWLALVATKPNWTISLIDA